MDNETPDYLKWVAEANGYVTKNGELASTTPVYDTNGNFKTSITPQEVQMQTAQPQSDEVAKQSEFSIGQTQQNQEGSGVDVNSMQTKIGSTGTFGDNTDTKGSAISTPAVNSNVVKLPAQNETQKLNDQYLQYAEEDNYKGMIDTLTAMSNNDGVDRTKQIADLTDRRNQKIQAQDDLYSQAYYEAMLTGNNKLASDILDMQKAYRDSVGYSESLTSMRDKELVDITIDYDYAYLNGINEIASYIPQVLGAIMDFQYDPTQDTALIRAQNQAISRVKEQSASTGMYYSSQTQYAIARACAELVPVYEQMAKDELKEKLNLLQNTATFLMNLEQTQFNMWRNQIELQFDKKKLERQEILDAWNRVNNMGYVDNEASIILGLPAGTLSNETQQYLQQRQDAIDAKIREFEQDKALYEYKAGIDVQKYAEEQRIKSYYDIKLKSTPSASSGSGSGLSYSQVDGILKSMIDGGAGENELIQFITNSGLGGDMQNALIAKSLYDKQAKENKDTEALDKTLSNVPKETINSLKELNITDTTYLNDLNKTLAEDITQGDKLVNEINRFVTEYGEEQTALMLDGLFNKYVQQTLDSKTSDFGDDGSKVKQALKNTLTYIDGIADKIVSSNLGDSLNGGKRGINSSKAQVISAMYENLIDQVDRTSDFDYSATDLWDNVDELKTQAKNDILKHILDKGKYGNKNGDLYMNIDSYIKGAGTTTRTVASSAETR